MALISKLVLVLLSMIIHRISDSILYIKIINHNTKCISKFDLTGLLDLGSVIWGEGLIQLLSKKIIDTNLDFYKSNTITFQKIILPQILDTSPLKKKNH